MTIPAVVIARIACKLAEKYGESGLVIDFVNSIARSVKNEYPDIFITTLAYGPAVNAPKNIRAESNVVVRLALLGNELRINKTSRDTLALSPLSDQCRCP